MYFSQGQRGEVKRYRLGLYSPESPGVMICPIGPDEIDPALADLAIDEYMQLTASYADEALALGMFQSSAPASAPVRPM